MKLDDAHILGNCCFLFSCHVSSATDLGTKVGRTKDGAGEWVGMGWGTPRARWGAALVSGYVPPEHECRYGNFLGSEHLILGFS